jgi:hypothetical protein
MVMLAVDAFFALDAAAEAAAAAEAISAAEAASVATAALTAGEIGAGAGAGLASVPAGLTQAEAAAMAQSAAAGGEGAGAGINALQQGTLAQPGAMSELAVKGTLPPTSGYTFPSGPEGTNFADFNYSASQAPTPPISATPSPAITSAVPPNPSFAPTFGEYSNGSVSSYAGPQSYSPAPPITPSPTAPAGINAAAPPQAAPADLRTTGWRANVPVSPNPFLNQSVDPALVSQPSLSSQLLGQTTTAPLAEPQSAFMKGLDKAMEFVDKYPKTSLAGAYLGAKVTGLLDPNYSNFNSAPYDGPLSKYKLSPNYKATIANPSQYQYAPRYAEGGIMQMAQGGVTGSGNLTLNVPIDFGGGQNDTQSTPNYAFGNENSGANTGFFGQNNTQVSAPSNPQGPVNAQQPSILGQQAGTPDLMQSLQQMKPDGQSAPINVGEPADVSQDQNQTKNFAGGGSTGNLSSTLDYYTKMMEGETPKMPSSHPTDAGIYHDTDPDTRRLDPYSAARVRQAKTNKRAYVSTPSFPAPTPMGQLNLSPPGAKADGTQYQEAAKGGIMGLSDLGGYAAGGNPRLLKGPGDGMSDNIPATINGRQPARLADGEFVIPADVVSHLGNGSTEAGAKVLHQMMAKVRQERTGNPRQGKQINPRKYMPR